MPGAPAHHRQHGFANADPTFARPPFWTRTTFFARRIWASTFHPRTLDLPRADNDGAALRANTSTPTITWIGHATFLVQLDGVNVLTDPQWSERASPLRFAGPKRLTPPGLRFEDLPPIHVVLISHDHFDHLDAATVKRLADVHHPRFYVPLGLKALLAGFGVTDVVELDWWDSRVERGLTLTCVPVQHWSARSFFELNSRLWSGWAIAGRERRAFFGGDTGYYAPYFEAIGARLGPFDLAAISIGAYTPASIMRFTHTTPEEALRLFADVHARRFVAMHWGTFDLADEPPAEPPGRLRAEAHRLGLPDDRVWILRHGETRGW
ncbi:MAG TPA: MBL fold metallo-hydrolase [Methylomirabilota bacterium]|nr:MBL fold metallo-hydrolase [Methylomirabilota bacterium]